MGFETSSRKRFQSVSQKSRGFMWFVTVQTTKKAIWFQSGMDSKSDFAWPSERGPQRQAAATAAAEG